MNLAALIAKLTELDPEAEVLLLSGSTDISETAQLRRVEYRGDWRCEVHFRDDGLSRMSFAPATFGRTLDYDEAYDRTVPAKVVLLATASANLDFMYVGDFAPKSRILGRDWIKNAALAGRRAMVEDGRLIPREYLLTLLDIEPKELDALVSKNSVFDVEVDGLSFFPSIFAHPRIDQQRLHAICRLIAPAPETSRLDFLLSPWTPLNGLLAVDMLDEDKDFKKLKSWSRAWAADWSRTAVRIFAGQHEQPPVGEEPIYTVYAEFDPRRPVWSRGHATLSEYGFEKPSPPYPQCDLFTIFVERQTRGTFDIFVEGVVCVERLDNSWCMVAVWPPSGVEGANASVRSEGHDVMSVCKGVLEELKKAPLR
jgi:hypothetical protein